MTYSIVAADPQTGEAGVAVQSHWFSVGPIVPWVRPGVGAAASQSVADPALGPKLLDALADGHAPTEAVRRALAGDDAAQYRQIAVVDTTGAVAVHTGESCIGFAGEQTGDGFSAQANMMASPEVWGAMAQAFDSAPGPLGRRLLRALHAAEAAGGDARGRQSAALLVAPAEGEPWRTSVELRVEDDPEPLAELDRLYDLHDAYALATEADDLSAAGDFDAAGDAYERASALAPGNHELLFWAGLAAAQGGDMPKALERVREAIAIQPGWRGLLDRLQPDIAPGAAAVRDALG